MEEQPPRYSPNKDLVPAFSKVPPGVLRLTSLQQLGEVRARFKFDMVVVLFWAAWYPECEEMKRDFDKWAPSLQRVKLFWTDVDKDLEVIGHFQITKIPYILLIHPWKDQMENILTLKPYQIQTALTKYNEYYQQAFELEASNVFERISAMIEPYPVVIFIRGDPSNPLCRSSKTLVECLTKVDLKFKSFDVTKDESMLQWLKLFSNWPDFPLVFVN